MEQVTITFADDTVESLDELAERRYGGNRDEAARALLDAWIQRN